MSIHDLLQIQSKIPDVKSTYTIAYGREVEIDTKDWEGRYIVAVFLTGSEHPISRDTVRDFSKAMPEFDQLNCRVVAVAPDTTVALFKWLEKSEEFRELDQCIPIVSDRNMAISG